MKPDVLVVRHSASGAAALLSPKVGCAVVNAGDGRHEHPTQALLDLLSLRRAFGDVGGLTIAICGAIAHSRGAGATVALLSMMGPRVRLTAPPPSKSSATFCSLGVSMTCSRSESDVTWTTTVFSQA